MSVVVRKTRDYARMPKQEVYSAHFIYSELYPSSPTVMVHKCWKGDPGTMTRPCFVELVHQTRDALKDKPGPASQRRPTVSEIALESRQWCEEHPSATKEHAFAQGARWATRMNTYNKEGPV